jgi:hypothetical protein
MAQGGVSNRAESRRIASSDDSGVSGLRTNGFDRARFESGAASSETDRSRDGNLASSLRQEANAEPLGRHFFPAVSLLVPPDDRPNYQARASTNPAVQKGTESTTAAVTNLAVPNEKPHQRTGPSPNRESEDRSLAGMQPLAATDFQSRHGSSRYAHGVGLKFWL